ncbi:NRDE family protein [Natronomonas marina]|uniref:NRDE family protein n=1 Tax=Natronomonas marina TaxID=2961939 RepID=UPI0020CA1DF8|nr:NRDE family protein [Natronomonas marina]
MCTLIVAWQVFEEAPVCVAANRDERFERPSTPPTVRGTDPAVLAPRDERADGTWLGYNESGVLAAVTNRWTAGEGERSRGLLTADALEEPTARAAVDRVEAELDAREYAPFHLLVADASDCFLVENGGTDDPLTDHRVTALDPGVHVVVNVGADGEWFVPPTRPDVGRRQAANADRVLETLQPRDGESAADWTRRAGEVLGDHEFGVCIHGDGFGTRSSSLVRLGEERVFEFADGPPCETAYERVEDRV